MGMTGWPAIIELNFEPLTQNAVFTEHNSECGEQVVHHLFSSPVDVYLIVIFIFFQQSA